MYYVCCKHHSRNKNHSCRYDSYLGGRYSRLSDCLICLTLSCQRQTRVVSYHFEFESRPCTMISAKHGNKGPNNMWNRHGRLHENTCWLGFWIRLKTLLVLLLLFCHVRKEHRHGGTWSEAFLHFGLIFGQNEWSQTTLMKLNNSFVTRKGNVQQWKN